MSKPYVLLVEDDPWLAELEETTLARAGYAVTTASTADEVLDLINKQIPDVIILDMLLTGTTAFALLHEFQSYGDTGGIPVIICTNMAESLDEDELRTYGVRRIVNKATMVPDDVVAAVRSVLA